jgi:DNA-binding GntR family transcriptional regulator
VRFPRTPLEDIGHVERSSTLGRRVREELRSAIMAGSFSPGEKLTIRAVASALGVSLTPAREALYNLAAEGALDMRENGSVYVHELDARRIAELTKIRMPLEGLAAREAGARMPAKELREAERLNERLVAADEAGDFRRVIDLNWQFHFLIYRASGLPLLVRMIESCWLMTGSYLNVLYPDFARDHAGIDNHQRIIEALLSKDPAGLEQAIERDIEHAAGALLKMIQARDHMPL